MTTPTDSDTLTARPALDTGNALPCGSWPSPISAAALVSDAIALSEPRHDRETLYWLEGRPSERGRCVIMRRDADGGVSEVSPADCNVRSRVHEYGGGAWAVRDDVLVYSDLYSGRVYCKQPGADPVAITPAQALRYADFEIDSARRCVYAVCEDHRAQAHEPVNMLVRLSLDGSNESGGDCIAKGHDFFAVPRLSPEGSQLAWISWDHPDMPWDSSRLWLADLDSRGSTREARYIAGGHQVSVSQPRWSPDGVLHFISDQNGWWNLYRWQAGKAQALWSQKSEFTSPLWVFGLSHYAFVDAQRILCTYTEHGIWRLALLDTEARQLQVLENGHSEYSGLSIYAHEAAFIAGTPLRPTALVTLDLNDSASRMTELRVSTRIAIDSGYLSQPQPIRFAGGQGRQAHAMYYPPRNPHCEAPAGTAPPLIVRGHGGPTAAVSTALNLATQFWTSRGFAVVDVNYSGSSGYGRAYRQRLDRAWGIADVEDCVHAAEYLVARGLADPERLAIRGSSAGGYTVLCALTFHDCFRAGVSLYGIGDLEALARDTHKFEKHYLDRLVGPYPAEQAVYRQRSPLYHVGQLKVPVLFLQGGEDKVVPPAQAEHMVEALRGNGVPVAYQLFPSEGHGFRQADTIIRALEAELAFYARVFGFTPADRLPDLAIDNL